jgi:tetratricopeptide (TPR) repeat protein
MIQSRSVAPWMLGGLLATGLVALAVIVAMGVSSKRRLTAASKLSQAHRARRLAERERLRAEVMKLRQDGKLDEAVAEAVTRDLDEDVESLFFLADEDWAAARKAATEVILIRERESDRKDWRIRDARQALADLDRWAALNPAQRQRLREAERLNRLQGALGRHGKYAEGIGPCRRAMEVWGELLGKDHPDYAISLGDLAKLYRAMGDYTRAEPTYREALAIQKKALGVDHPDYAVSLNDLGELYRALGDYARAEPMYRLALAIKKKALGENHPGYAATLHNLALLCSAMADYEQAEPLLRRRLRSRRRRWEWTTATMPRPSATWACFTRKWATTPAPSRCFARPWRSGRGRWAWTTPTTPHPSITWPRCTWPWATTPAPSRCSARR